MFIQAFAKQVKKCYVFRIMKYYLAGGAIRNILWGFKPADYDFVFSNTEEEFISLNPQARKLGFGPAFGLDGREFTKLYAGSIEKDLLKRDFTINCFLMDENGFVHMHPSALNDLKNNCLNPASQGAFKDDPLRIFRAARFCAVFPSLTPSERCFALMRGAAQDAAFKNIAAERVGHECIKALSGEKPGNFLRRLSEAGALSYWFEELTGADKIPAGPVEYHKTDVLEHIAAVMDKTVQEFERNGDKNNETRMLAAWMALCHDLGKVNTPENILPHHYQHELRGMYAASNLAKRLRMPKKLYQAGILAAKLHMKAGLYPKLRPGSRVDMLMEAHSKNMLLPLFLLAQADSGNADLLELAADDLNIIVKIKLPEKWQNIGKKSGKKLRELRCQNLKMLQ
jgi:tRNA nucleotidyltransferase (CCA-adding enzyme)